MSEKEVKKITAASDTIEEKNHVKQWRRIRKKCEPYFKPFAPLLKWTIIPGTRFASIWLALSLIAALIQSTFVSFQVAFNVPDENSSHIGNQIASIILVADIGLNFFTAFINKEGKLICSKREIAKRYLRGHFIFDLLSNFPIEWFVKNRYSLLIRVFIIHKPIVWIRERSKLLNMSIGVEVAKYVLLLLYIIHFYSCIWWTLGIPKDSHSHTWSFPEDSHKPTSIDLHSEAMKNEYFSKYLYSIYWVLNVITVPGFADLEAPSLLEKVVGLFMFLSGLVLLGYLSASVTSILANRGAQKARHQQKLMSLCQFMTDNKINSNTQDRVQRYYNYLWSRTKGIDSKSIFEDFPTTFQAELSLDINGTLLAKVPLFQNTEIGFMRMLSLALQPVLFLPMEYVVRKGDIGTEMFFIHKGSVDVVSDDGSKVFASMLEGSFFGEIALFFSRPRTANIRCATYCDIYVLSKADLDAVLEFYPTIRESILKEASERLKENLKRNNIAVPPAPSPPVAAPTPAPAPNPPPTPRSPAELPEESQKPPPLHIAPPPALLPSPQLDPTPSASTTAPTPESNSINPTAPPTTAALLPLPQTPPPLSLSPPTPALLITSSKRSVELGPPTKPAKRKSRMIESSTSVSHPVLTQTPPQPFIPTSLLPLEIIPATSRRGLEYSLSEYHSIDTTALETSASNINSAPSTVASSFTSYPLIQNSNIQRPPSEASLALSSNDYNPFEPTLHPKESRLTSNSTDANVELDEDDQPSPNASEGSSISLMASPGEVEDLVYNQLVKTESIKLGDSIYALNVQPKESLVPKKGSTSSPNLSGSMSSLAAPMTSQTNNTTTPIHAPLRRGSVPANGNRRSSKLNSNLNQALDYVLHKNLSGASSSSSPISSASKPNSKPASRKPSLKPPPLRIQIDNMNTTYTKNTEGSTPGNEIVEVPLSARRRYSHYDD